MIAILQALLSLVIGCGVFVLWRRTAASSRAVYWLVTLGVLVRAVGGQLAFWISYLHLPFARSLQIGNGLWIFALDATKYFEIARGAASAGLPAIISLDKTNASVFFVQTLAMFLLTLGAVTSVAVLLNVAAYLGCCRAILSFGDPKQHRSIVVAIAALSLSPSAIVWSLQPLKDTVFLFLVAAFFAAARLWQQLWSDDARERRLPRAAMTTLLMVVVLYGISGIRWYFGIVILLASLPFVLLTTLRSRQRWIVAANALVLMPLLGAAFFSGAGPYVPAAVREAVLGRDLKKHVQLPNVLFGYVGLAREGFDRAGGATMITTGRAVRKTEATIPGVAAAPPPVLRRKILPPAAPPADTSKVAPPEAIAASAPEPVPMPMSSAMGDVQPAAVPPAAISPAPVPPPAPVRAAAPVRAPAPAHEHHAVRQAPAIASPPAAAQIPAALPVTAEPVEGSSSSGTINTPSSRTGRLVAGMAAVVLPRVIAQRLGILDVHGGRGLWLFVELDTLAFDVILIFALVSLARAVRRGAVRPPVFWMIIIVTLTMGGALAYAVSNFGTLFRHRNMILLGLALLPIALAEQPRNEAAEEIAQA